jgi:hypothetical protein
MRYYIRFVTKLHAMFCTSDGDLHPRPLAKKRKSISADTPSSKGASSRYDVSISDRLFQTYDAMYSNI